MLMVRSPAQQAQAIELICSLGGAKEGQRWERAVRLLKTSPWGWTTGFAPCAQRILGLGARRDLLLRGFSVDCALHIWRSVPITADSLADLWPRPWKTARRVLPIARSRASRLLPSAYARARRDMRWIYRKLGSADQALRKLYQAARSTKSACIAQAGRAAVETANHVVQQDGAAFCKGWFISRLLETSAPEWLRRVPA